MEHDRQVDLRGLCCGALIRKLASGVRAMHQGEVLLVEGDIESLRTEIPSYCRQTRHDLLQHEQEARQLRFWIRKVG
ncbi:MAG: sulfurtransferase TusA family protein [Betaproteobacteria bacterium]|nr:sulfurtransferase TusA family protein [Betaproteobacteria bacterium]